MYKSGKKIHILPVMFKKRLQSSPLICGGYIPRPLPEAETTNNG